MKLYSEERKEYFGEREKIKIFDKGLGLDLNPVFSNYMSGFTVQPALS